MKHSQFKDTLKLQIRAPCKRKIRIRAKRMMEEEGSEKKNSSPSMPQHNLKKRKG